MSYSMNLKVSASEFETLNRQLMSYFRRRVPQRSAQDLAADTWLSITRWYQGKCSLRTYAFIVASKQVIHARHGRELLTTPLTSTDEPAAEGPGPYSVLRLLVNHAAIERALEQLDDDIYRDVVRRWLDGCDNVQIAAELGIPYNTVRSRLGRGRAQVLSAVRAEFGLE